MRRLLFGIVAGVVGLVGNRVGAQEVQLQISTPSVDINGTFGVSVRLQAIDGGNITIDGMEQFQVIGQSTSESIQIINGVSTQETVLQLQVRPTEKGTFTVGPARVTSTAGEQISNTVEISIEGEKLFGVNSVSPLDTEKVVSGGSANAVRVVLKRGMVGLLCLMTLVVVLKHVVRKRDNGEVEEIVPLTKALSSSFQPEIMPDPERDSFLHDYDAYLRGLLMSTILASHDAIPTLTYDELLTLCHENTNDAVYQTLHTSISALKMALYGGGSYDAEEMMQTLVSLRDQIITK